MGGPVGADVGAFGEFDFASGGVALVDGGHAHGIEAEVDAAVGGVEKLADEGGVAGLGAAGRARPGQAAVGADVKIEAGQLFGGCA